MSLLTIARSFMRGPENKLEKLYYSEEEFAEDNPEMMARLDYAKKRMAAGDPSEFQKLIAEYDAQEND